MTRIEWAMVALIGGIVAFWVVATIVIGNVLSHVSEVGVKSVVDRVWYGSDYCTFENEQIEKTLEERQNYLDSKL